MKLFHRVDRLPAALAAVLILSSANTLAQGAMAGGGAMGAAPAPTSMPTIEFTDALVQQCASEWAASFSAGETVQITDTCPWDQVLDVKDAYRINYAAVEMLGLPRVGYKVTTAGDGNVLGTLLQGMVQPESEAVDLSAGAGVIAEADILVRVSDERINSATSLEGVVRYIDVMIPFIESSDMMLGDGLGRTKALWTASNGNARFGVAGAEIPVEPTAEFIERFGAMQVVVVDDQGVQQKDSTANNNPLNAVLTVLEELQARGYGEQLHVGDLISLGTYGGPIRTVTPGSTLTATYYGLQKEPIVVTASYK